MAISSAEIKIPAKKYEEINASALDGGRDKQPKVVSLSSIHQIADAPSSAESDILRVTAEEKKEEITHQLANIFSLLSAGNGGIVRVSISDINKLIEEITKVGLKFAKTDFFDKSNNRANHCYIISAEGAGSKVELGERMPPLISESKEIKALTSAPPPVSPDAFPKKESLPSGISILSARAEAPGSQANVQIGTVIILPSYPYSATYSPKNSSTDRKSDEKRDYALRFFSPALSDGHEGTLATSSIKKTRLIQDIDFCIPQLTSYFVPTTYADTLDDFFNKGGRCIAITGVAGSGKTELANYYAHSFMKMPVPPSENEETKEEESQSKAVVWYLEADNETTLTRGLNRLATHFNLLTRADNEKWEVFFLRICQQLPYKLKNYPNSLFILNNVNDYASIQPLLDAVKTTSTKLIVTTQLREFFNREENDTYVITDNLEIGKGMSAREATCLFKKMGIPENEENISKLVMAVDGLPLALSLICHYMINKKIKSIEEYEKRAEDNLKLRHELKIIAGKMSYKKAFTLPIDEILESNPTAFQLLLFASFLHPDNIEENIFKHYLKENNPTYTEQDLTENLLNSMELLKNMAY